MKLLAIFGFFALLGFGNSLSCQNDKDCSSVSVSRDYVMCEYQQCVCKTQNGFKGNASLEDPCVCDYTVYGGALGPYCKQCELPRKIEYDQMGIPRCLNKAECEIKLITKYNSMKSVVTEFWRAIATKRNFELEEFFTQDLQGRADPYTVKGVRNNPHLAVDEIIYDRLLNIRSLVITSLTVDPQINVVHSIINVEVLVAFIGYNTNVTVQVTWSFNEDGTKIAQYEYHAQNIDASVNVNFATAEGLTRSGLQNNPLVNISNPIGSATKLVKYQVCNVHARYCAANETLKQFGNFSDCLTFLDTLPVSGYSYGWRNTLSCRGIHQNLVPFNPSIHCEHLGKTSTACRDDVPRSRYYKDSFLPNFTPIVLYDINDYDPPEIPTKPAIECFAPQ